VVGQRPIDGSLEIGAGKARHPAAGKQADTADKTAAAGIEQPVPLEVLATAYVNIESLNGTKTVKVGGAKDGKVDRRALDDDEIEQISKEIDRVTAARESLKNVVKERVDTRTRRLIVRWGSVAAAVVVILALTAAVIALLYLGQT
jgi:hypothetical protein